MKTINPTHMHLRTLICVFFLSVTTLCSAQITIPGTKVSINLPTTDWKYLQTNKVDKNTTIYLYSYKRSIVADSDGDTVIPFLRVYVKQHYTKTVYELAYDRYVQQPYQSIEDYTINITGEEGIGYVGAYTSPSDDKDYQFRMVYFLDGNTGFEFRMETSLNTFPQFEQQFQTILQSITAN